MNECFYCGKDIDYDRVSIIKRNGIKLVVCGKKICQKKKNRVRESNDSL